MQVVLELSDQEYRNALDLCEALGKPKKYENLVQIIKSVLNRNSFSIPTPLGSIDAWIGYPEEDGYRDIGLAFTPNIGGETIDLAYAKYDAESQKIVTKVFADIMIEDETSEFSFGEEDIKRAFPYE